MVEEDGVSHCTCGRPTANFTWRARGLTPASALVRVLVGLRASLAVAFVPLLALLQPLVLSTCAIGGDIALSIWLPSERVHEIVSSIFSNHPSGRQSVGDVGRIVSSLAELRGRRSDYRRLCQIFVYAFINDVYTYKHVHIHVHVATYVLVRT